MTSSFHSHPLPPHYPHNYANLLAEKIEHSWKLGRSHLRQSCIIGTDGVTKLHIMLVDWGNILVRIPINFCVLFFNHYLL